MKKPRVANTDNDAQTASAGAELQQAECAAQLPDEVLEFLVRSAPPREVWKWLDHKERRAFTNELTRGFQRTAQALQQPVVRSRLVAYIRNKPTAFEALLNLWAKSKPSVLDEVRGAGDDQQLVAHLPQLWDQHGTEALLLALIVEERTVALEAWEELADAPSTELTSPDPAAAIGEVQQEAEFKAEAALQDFKHQVEEERRRADKWQSLVKEAQARAKTAEKELAQAQELSAREKKKITLQLKHEERRALAAEEALAEAGRAIDRTTRKCKAAEEEAETAAAEIKRLKRQLRHQQEVNEELRKQLVTFREGVEHNAAKPAAPTFTPKPAPKKDPKRQPGALPVSRKPAAARFVLPAQQQGLSIPEQPFVWEAEGTAVKVSPREIQRAIERNDEDFVFGVVQALDALRELNTEGYRLFITRVRELSRYYARVLTADTTRVLIDASNVARYESNRQGKGQLRHLLTMREELRRRDCFPILIYADASLPYHIDEPAEFKAMVKRGEIQMAAAGQEADELLAREARRTGAYVVTNDRTFHHKVTPDFEPPRITFRIIDGAVLVEDF